LAPGPLPAAWPPAAGTSASQRPKESSAAAPPGGERVCCRSGTMPPASSAAAGSGAARSGSGPGVVLRCLLAPGPPSRDWGASSALLLLRPSPGVGESSVGVEACSQASGWRLQGNKPRARTQEVVQCARCSRQTSAGWANPCQLRGCRGTHAAAAAPASPGCCSAGACYAEGQLRSSCGPGRILQGRGGPLAGRGVHTATWAFCSAGCPGPLAATTAGRAPQHTACAPRGALRGGLRSSAAPRLPPIGWKAPHSLQNRMTWPSMTTAGARWCCSHTRHLWRNILAALRSAPQAGTWQVGLDMFRQRACAAE
jgi:hypothetical protein